MIFILKQLQFILYDIQKYDFEEIVQDSTKSILKFSKLQSAQEIHQDKNMSSWKITIALGHN